MYKKFGQTLKPYIMGSTDPNNTQEQFVNAINAYFTNVFMSHQFSACWKISGIVSAGVVETPLMGPFGCVNSFTFFPITAKKFKRYLNNFGGLYIGIAKSFEEMINKSILSVDAKAAGYTMPVTVKFVTNLSSFGNRWQKYMDTQKCSSLSSWYDTLDIFVENIWNYIPPITVMYAAPSLGNFFTGEMMVTGKDLTLQ